LIDTNKKCYKFLKDGELNTAATGMLVGNEEGVTGVTLTFATD